MDRVSLPEVSGLMRHLASSNRHNLLIYITFSFEEQMIK